ncbi:Sec-independent protein translocase protein TatB [Pseudomonas stutzeri]|uniref:Sec-independent protein translocase protein TatB n=1 Tax=Stutzerimonas stutzeri TaxID=316 RepID=A0A2N8SW62_STUST|nr:Sec-independent protein translocase protein TatB [Stutzerimonas stutzeri]MCQ4247969.1 Sec-independent protein translocase protein TatB [Stutzerimonas stutzeri]PNG06723.1 twin-arginine translocase subunit TatB [Stutzerimonas stutzeri]
MFDIGFTELLLIGLVALVVLGPERLPGAVRTAGLWIGRAKRSFANIKAEVEREIGADEIRRQLHNERILDLEREMKQSIMPNPPGTGSNSSPQSATPPPDASKLEAPAPAETAKPTETSLVPRPDRPAEP